MPSGKLQGMLEMSEKIPVKHEAEYTRQHARYQIPASFRLDEKDHPLTEWSVSGFSSDNISTDMQDGDRFETEISFSLESFNLSMKVEAEIIRYQKDKGAIACRFVDVTRRNLSLLHYIINAYMAGEVVTAGDVLHVASREAFTPVDPEQALPEHHTAFQNVMLKTQRVVGQLIFFAIFIILIAFLGHTGYQRIFVINAMSAKISAPLMTVRSPDDGIYEASQGKVSGAVSKGQPLGLIKFTTGGATILSSPCDCTVAASYAIDNGFSGKGEVIFKLLPKDSSYLVEAKIPAKKLEKIKLGQSAEVLLPNGSNYIGKVKDVMAAGINISAENEMQSKSESEPTVTALIETDEPLPATALDSVASVKIYTLKNTSI